MKLLILGSTGSIGTSTCQCVRRYRDRFTVSGLSANSRTDALCRQAREFDVADVCIGDRERARAVRSSLPSSVRLFTGTEGLEAIVREGDFDVLVNALVGAVGLRPTAAALERGKTVALANKESLVVGGEYLNGLLRRRHGRIIPIDSEHSAIAQCLLGENRASIESIILTASGGPFRDRPLEAFHSITPEEALHHPTWSMGKKITIDSATLINKGFELIEAHHLFGLPYERLRVWIHQQSIIHSLVEFHDGAVMAQMGVPDMELPIQFALTYPERVPLKGKRLNLPEIESLTFARPDTARFPCLGLCREAGREGGTVPAVLNAANEVAVGLFLRKKIAFPDIAAIIRDAIDDHKKTAADSLGPIEEADRRTRENIVRVYS